MNHHDFTATDARKSVADADSLSDELFTRATERFPILADDRRKSALHFATKMEAVADLAVQVMLAEIEPLMEEHGHDWGCGWTTERLQFWADHLHSRVIGSVQNTIDQKAGVRGQLPAWFFRVLREASGT